MLRDDLAVAGLCVACCMRVMWCGFRRCTAFRCLSLTGSERISKSEATGDRLKEAQHINKSLSALGDVMAALGAKKPHIPYRNSKLTTVLQDSLGASRSHRVGSAPQGAGRGL